MTRDPDPWTLRQLTDEEVEALATLARHGRVLAILIPPNVDDETIKALSREVNGRLEELGRDASGS